MAVKGTVQELGASKKGSPKVKVQGYWYFAGSTDVTNMKVGMPVELEVRSFMAGDKELWGISQWKATGQPQNATGRAPVDAGAAISITPSPIAPYLDEAATRFISNVVGSAITAGLIEAPDAVSAWAHAARAAHHAITQWKPIEVQDEIPI